MEPKHNRVLELSFTKKRRERRRRVFTQQASNDEDATGVPLETVNGLDTVDGSNRLSTGSQEILNEAKTKCKELLGDLFEIVCYLFCAGMYVFDIGSDLWAAYLYWNDEETWHFWVTVAVVAVSTLTMVVMGFYFYVCDYQNESNNPDDMSPTWVWTVRFILTVCCLGPFLRYMEVAIRGVMSRKTKNRKESYRSWMNNAIFDGAIMGLIESFFESAPQLAVQLYIIQTQGPEKDTFRLFVQTGSCLSSWWSCAWSIVTWSRARRVSQRIDELSYPAMLALYLWTLLTIGPRTLAFALFASIDVIGYYVLVAIGCHWVLFTIYVISCRTNFCNHKVAEIFFNMVVGFICVFTFFNVKGGHTRRRYAVFYLLVFAENIGMVITWFLFTRNVGNWYCIPAIIFVVLGFMLGIVFLFLYYLCLHPKRKFCSGYERTPDTRPDTGPDTAEDMP